MQLIIKNKLIIATHKDSQDVADKYPGCECIQWSKPLPPRGICDPPQKDPRSEVEKILAYRDKRRCNYPSIQEQLDMLYHDKVNGTDAWLRAIEAVKKQYPKVEMSKK